MPLAWKDLVKALRSPANWKSAMPRIANPHPAGLTAAKLALFDF
jgi:hypothetical protein